MPADFSDTYGNFLKGTDIPVGREIALTIAGAAIQEFNQMGAATGQSKQRKLVLSFHETTKLLVCNSGNSRTVADAYGSNTDFLAGKKILLSRVATQMGPGVLLRVPAPAAPSVAGDPFAAHAPAPSVLVGGGNAAASAAPNNPAPARDTDFNDPIPF
jgi:hypothetical protein